MQQESHTSRIVLASGADDKYALPLTVTITSALRHLEREQPVRLYLLDGGIREGNRARIERAARAAHAGVELCWIRPDQGPLAGLTVNKWYSQAMYLRLLLPSLLPDEDRVIYLDSDLVVSSNLGELWSMPLGHHLALAAQDFWSPVVSCPAALPETYRDRGLSEDTLYCNTGLLVIPLARWRQDEIAEDVIEYVRRNHQYVRYGDQDGLNAVIGGRWGVLDPTWNVTVNTIHKFAHHLPLTDAEREEAQLRLLREARIYHFAGRAKPWSGKATGLAAARFDIALRRSGWFSPAAYARWYARYRLAPRVGRPAKSAAHTVARVLAALLSAPPPPI